MLWESQELILAHRNVLDACARLLIEKEKISRAEFEALFAPKAVVEEAAGLNE